MKCGTLCYDTTQGLSLLAKSFVDNHVVTDVMVVEHGRRPTNHDWYPNAPRLGVVKETQQLRDFIDSMDVMLFFETPFVWSLLNYARNRGTKTVICPMHECLDERRIKEYKPDLYLCPSLIEYQLLCPMYMNDDTVDVQFLPVPVEVPWRQRTHAKVFVHNAGWGGLRGRNGTEELLAALQYIESPIHLILRTQVERDVRTIPLATRRKVTIDYRRGTQSFDQLWNEGDVFVFAERFNGLSLPLQEARAAGMLVVCGDRFPMTTWLPTEPMIPVKNYNKNQRTFPQFCAFDEAVYDPRDIAATIDQWYNVDITEYSLQGNAWAKSMSWGVLGPKYKHVLEKLL